MQPRPACGRARPAYHDRCGGQSLIETCFAIMLICLMLCGLLQISQLFAAKEVLHHAAARAARAKTVGFNSFMVTKATRIAAIPVSGRMREPEFTNDDLPLRAMLDTLRPGTLWDTILSSVTPSGLQYEIERARIPEYLGAEHWSTAHWVLDYEDWDALRVSLTASPGTGDPLLRSSVRHRFPLWVPMHRTFYDADSVEIEGETRIENHYPLYIDDSYW
jgi:hypothetical protein